MKIFIISPNVETLFAKDQLTSLEAAGDVTLIKDIKPLTEVTELYSGDEERIVAIDPDFSDWKFPNDVIDKIPNLKAVCLQTTSFSWVDVDYCQQKGVPVVNLRGFSTIAVSEWITLMALAATRRLPLVVQNDWKIDYEKHRGFELRGKTAGIIGLGHIGTAAAENFAGLGMKVRYWSKNSQDDRFEKATLENLMQTSDVIALTVASNKDTEGLIGDDVLKTMKPTTVFVNIAHLDIYNHELLLQLAADNKVGGYAFEDEKDPVGKYEGNVWNGPALGWCTNESMSKNAEQWVESIEKAVKGEYPTRVN